MEFIPNLNARPEFLERLMERALNMQMHEARNIRRRIIPTQLAIRTPAKTDTVTKYTDVSPVKLTFD